MEIAVSCCAGALCGLSSWFALRWADGARVRMAAARGSGARAAVRGAAAALGPLLMAAVPPAAADAALRELSLLKLPGAGRAGRLDRDAAVGLVALVSLASGLTGAVIAGFLAGAVAGALLPPALIAARASARERAERKKVEEAMPEAFGALAVSLGSGLSLAQAMRYVGDHAEEPVRTEFTRVSFSIACGIPAAEALADMIGRLRAPGLELVTLALSVSQRTGAPLKGLLADAAKLVDERIGLARKLDVKTAQARMSARLVAGMPVAMIVFLSLLSSDFRTGVATAPGALSVALALCMNAAAWLIIRRIMRVRL